MGELLLYEMDQDIDPFGNLGGSPRQHWQAVLRRVRGIIASSSEIGVEETLHRVGLTLQAAYRSAGVLVSIATHLDPGRQQVVFHQGTAAKILQTGSLWLTGELVQTREDQQPVTPMVDFHSSAHSSIPTPLGAALISAGAVSGLVSPISTDTGSATGALIVYYGSHREIAPDAMATFAQISTELAEGVASFGASSIRTEIPVIRDRLIEELVDTIDSAEDPIDNFPERVARLLKELFPYDGLSISLLDEDRVHHRLLLLSGDLRPGMKPGTRVRLTEDEQLAIERGRPVLRKAGHLYPENEVGLRNGASQNGKAGTLIVGPVVTIGKATLLISLASHTPGKIGDGSAGLMSSVLQALEQSGQRLQLRARLQSAETRVRWASQLARASLTVTDLDGLVRLVGEQLNSLVEFDTYIAAAAEHELDPEDMIRWFAGSASDLSELSSTSGASSRDSLEKYRLIQKSLHDRNRIQHSRIEGAGGSRDSIRLRLGDSAFGELAVWLVRSSNEFGRADVALIDQSLDQLDIACSNVFRGAKIRAESEAERRAAVLETRLSSLITGSPDISTDKKRAAVDALAAEIFSPCVVLQSIDDSGRVEDDRIHACMVPDTGRCLQSGFAGRADWSNFARVGTDAMSGCSVAGLAGRQPSSVRINIPGAGGTKWNLIAALPDNADIDILYRKQVTSSTLSRLRPVLERLLTVPLTGSGSSHRPGEALPPRSLGGTDRIILIDSHEDCRVGLRAIVSEFTSCRVESGGPEDLLELIRFDNSPAVVLVQLHVGEEPDLDLIRLARTASSGVKFMLIAEAPADIPVTPALESGVTAVVNAGLAPELLGGAVNQLIHGRVVLDRGTITQLMEPGPESERVSNLIETLGERDREILKQIAKGRSNSEIAASMHLAEGTIRNRLMAVYKVLGVSRRLEAAVLASSVGLVSPPTHSHPE